MKKQRIPKAVGRPTKADLETRRLIIDALRKCMPFTYACDLVGIHRTTGYNWLKSNKSFSIEVAIAKAEAIQGLVALTAKQNGAWKILKNIGKEQFKEQIEITEEYRHTLTIKAPDGRELKQLRI